MTGYWCEQAWQPAGVPVDVPALPTGAGHAEVVDRAALAAVLARSAG
jgi:hypothetical protein